MKRLPTIHPFLFSIFPILFLYAQNIAFFPSGVLIRPIAALLILTFILLVFFRFLFKDKRRASVVTSFLLITAFSYKHFNNLIGVLSKFIVIPGREAFSFSLWFLVVALGLLLIFKKIKRLRKVNSSLNVVAISLIVMSFLNIGAYYARKGVSLKKTETSEGLTTDRHVLGVSSYLPDIYYIILDGYGSSDVLKEIYGYDNSELIRYFINSGFYVAENSKSNYGQSVLSLASSLNLDYVNDLINNLNIDSNDRLPLNDLVREGKATSFLRENGYKFVVISSGYFGTEIKDADIFITTGNNLSEFENAILDSTPVPVVLEVLFSSQEHGIIEFHRRRVMGTFEELSGMGKVEGPKFVFVHIMSPHPPFVFGEHGEEINHRESEGGFDGSHLIKEGGITKEEYIELYKGQAKFVSGKMISTLEKVFSGSEKRPIVVVQADHGPGSMLDWDSPNNTNLKERFSILNAYFLPEGGGKYLYDSITPVNTFRVIFNHYFATDYELLADRSYFSTWSKPHDLIDVTEEVGLSGD